MPTSLVPQVGQSFLAHTTAQAPLSLAFTDFLAQRRSVTLIAVLIKIKIPSALPNLGAGMRIAATIAPIGAIVGEWVGASKGLGFLMLNANARMQIDIMFAALILIIILSLSLYYIVDTTVKKTIFWRTA